jgi:protein involved in polysaccharide export with SLBB domain
MIRPNVALVFTCTLLTAGAGVSSIAASAAPNAVVPTPTAAGASPAPLGRSFQAVPMANRTLIHPGDQLNVQVFGDTTLTENVMVLSDGTVNYPLVGRVMLAGKTPQAAAAVLSQHLMAYVKHPAVTVSILQLGQPTVLVLGNVKTPGKYQLRDDARISDAIAAAGGLGPVNGLYPDARISDENGQVQQVSLQKLLREGDATLDEPLGEGSVVYVPGPVQFTVDVAGAVDHPGDVEINQGDHLSVAIARAGDSANAQADLNHIRVIRVGPDGKQTTQEINLYKALNDGDQSADLALQKGDVIYVPQASKHNLMDSTNPFLYILSRLIP